MICRLQRVPLREVWQHEVLDFATWLEENLDVLKDALDIRVSTADREHPAGAFFFAQEGFDEEPVGGSRLRLASSRSTIRGSSHTA
jgi:hypothetical protein